MCLESDRPTARSTHIVASCHLHVISAAKQGIGSLTAHHPLAAFPRLEEICAEMWEEEVDALVQSTWKTKTMKDPLWETKREYIEEWRRNTLIMTTSSYHNLVIRWNMGTLLQGPTNPPRVMESATYYLTDDEQMDLSVMVLGLEQSSRN